MSATQRATAFDQLCATLPALREIERDALKVAMYLALDAPRSPSQFDIFSIWSRLFKPRLEDLLLAPNAYEIAYAHLFRALNTYEQGRGRGRMGEDERAVGHIGTAELLRIVVEELRLPRTRAYLKWLSEIEAAVG